jgi:hypothetical protein
MIGTTDMAKKQFFLKGEAETGGAKMTYGGRKLIFFCHKYILCRFTIKGRY